MFWDQQDKNCQAQSPTGPGALHHHLRQRLLSQFLFENNELMVRRDISLLPFALLWSYFKSKSQMLGYWCSTWLSCNGVERKMAAYLITGVKRLWRRQKSRTPWEKQERRSRQGYGRKMWFILNQTLLQCYLRYDIVHVTPGVVGAIVVAKAIQYRLRFELVFVCD